MQVMGVFQKNQEIFYLEKYSGVRGRYNVVRGIIFRQK